MSLALSFLPSFGSRVRHDGWLQMSLCLTTSHAWLPSQRETFKTGSFAQSLAYSAGGSAAWGREKGNLGGARDRRDDWSNFWNDTEHDRYAELDINVTHPIKLTRIAIRALLRKNKKGVVVVVASIAG
ncbi:hypothetical protein VE01_07170 [Pseudogymnoascus verrucosus]|uniref:Uncharacterized protein n=1 Tax=Pseudogymnoascus verrucosus TaxID=342668 RepID=A0A1B8GE24_9PEZI|nr:uncharacterized protein VE01_07170 [Pseudogymnoascus verrucosus]OBT94063.1 hypothetical protein VE01_07170 [Pseudogymnoascus verrucosus]